MHCGKAYKIEIESDTDILVKTLNKETHLPWFLINNVRNAIKSNFKNAESFTYI